MKGEKILNEYAAYLQEKGASPNMIISYTNDLNIFFNDLHIDPDDYVVTPADIRK